ncbi:MAG: hypothetical protein H6621_00095 [Halobacteriovoraceae bacterium]|nr:hypothetical protein [Halobacteriovoraceae bacterium]MCB9093440.1 hypothetical protein [Halobacteriovoraceae bacterium]
MKNEEVMPEDIKKEDEIKPIDQWVALNNVLRLYRISGVALSGVTIVLTVALLFSMFRDPIVVVKENGRHTFLHGKHKAEAITENDIEEFVQEFISLGYVWEELNPNLTASQLAPITTEGLNEKLRGILIQFRDKEFKDKKMSQSVANVKVTVTENKVIATFDKLLKIENVPLPVPTQISLNIVSGSRTVWNPRGLYVNGVIEHNAN